ncbi:MAG TPA: hypothetical protein VIV40_30850 [Kofleriaceae bacterium]
MIRALALVLVCSSVAFAQPGAEPPAQDAPAEDAPAEGSQAEGPPAKSDLPPDPQPTREPPMAEPPRRTPFDRGRFGFSGGAGTSSALGQRYYGVGASASYFVLDGVAVGLGSQLQWGDGPTITRVTPELRYVVQPLVGRWPLVPYVGVFYSHWFVAQHIADVDAIGTRAGLLYVSGSVVLGLGAAYEHLVSDCTEDCSSIYPDITISVAL